MTAFKKLKGRPELREGKRSKKIDARFTEEEYQLILDLEKQLGITKTELVRMRVLHVAKHIVVNAKELISHLDAIGAEMGRAGNNINQLATHANTMKLLGDVPPIVVIHFNELLAGYIAIQKTLETALRKIIRLMGK